MSKTEIIEENEFFTAGITEHERGVFTPFFMLHEAEGDFCEESPTESQEAALLRLIEIIIHCMDAISAPGEDDEPNGDDEPLISLVGGTLPAEDVGIIRN